MAPALRDAAESAASVQRLPVAPLRPPVRAAAVVSAQRVFDPALEERPAVPLERPVLGPAPECAAALLVAVSPEVSLDWPALRAAVSLGQLAARSDWVARVADLAVRQGARSAPRVKLARHVL